MKRYQAVIKCIFLIFCCNFTIINSIYAKDITIATVGASLTGGVSGHSPAEISNIENDNFIEKCKKKLSINLIDTHLYPYRTLAKIIENQKKGNLENNQNRLIIIDAFTKSKCADIKYFTNISNLFFISGFVEAIIDPLSSLKKQINYAKSKNVNIIIGIDMFFWSVYNNYTDKNIKASDDLNYSKQLKQIDMLLNYLDLPENKNINFVVGNIPYKSLHVFIWDLNPTQEFIKTANQKIADWIIKRNQENNGKVLLVDTTKFFETPEKYAELLEIDSPLLIEELVSTDGLHPSSKGQELIARAILKTMANSEYEIFKKVGQQFN